MTREAIVAMMEAEPLPVDARCALFRATFRNRRDDWADAAWGRFAGGGCAGERVRPRAAAAAASG